MVSADVKQKKEGRSRRKVEGGVGKRKLFSPVVVFVVLHVAKP